MACSRNGFQVAFTVDFSNTMAGHLDEDDGAGGSLHQAERALELGRFGGAVASGAASGY